MRPIERVGIRFAEELDAAAIQAIYAPYCESSAVSFETKAPSVEEIGQRIRKISDQFPWIVGERDRRVIGYAYGSRHSERAAYQWSVDATSLREPFGATDRIGARVVHQSLSDSHAPGLLQGLCRHHTAECGQRGSA